MTRKHTLLSGVAAVLALTFGVTLAAAPFARAETTNPGSGPGQDNTTPTDVATAGTQLDLEVLRGRSLFELGQFAEARAIAKDVLQASPDHVGALRLFAASEDALGRWRVAAPAFDKLAVQYGDTAAAKRRDELLKAFRSDARAGAVFEGNPGENQQFGGRLDVNYRTISAPEVHITLEARRAEVDETTRLNGTVGPIEKDGLRASVGVGDRFSWGSADAKLTAGPNGVGAAVSATPQLGANTKVSFSAGYNEPYWLYGESIAAEARVDHIGIGAHGKIGPVALRGDVRHQNYGVSGDKSVAESTRVVFGADIVNSLNENAVRVAYVLDAEYFDRRETRRRSDGSTYLPLPFARREIHSLGLYKLIGARSETHIDLGAGYRVDRYGAEGPFIGANGEVALNEKTRLGVRSEYSEVSARGENNEPYGFIEVYLRRTF